MSLLMGIVSNLQDTELTNLIFKSLGSWRYLEPSCPVPADHHRPQNMLL